MTGIGDVRWSGVGFAYPDGPAVLTDVSLDLEAGEVLLVVGESGSGKSSLAS